MEIEEKEINTLIAERVKGKGDTWILVGEDVEHPSLTEALEAYFQKSGISCHFRLEPLNSKHADETSRQLLKTISTTYCL